MLRVIYRALWWVVAPIAVIRLYVRSRKERGYREHIGERFGHVAGRSRDDRAPLIWVHAVSVGETRAAQPLIDALMHARPDARILLTHMTPSGRATGEQIFGDRVLRCYLPYDMPGAVRRFLHAWRPTLGLVMETEVWPTLIDECRRADVPLVLTNARMSARSFRRASKFGAATHDVFGGFSRVLAQISADAERLTSLGARNVTVLGNLKFDMTTPRNRGARPCVARGDRHAARVGGREHARERGSAGARRIRGDAHARRAAGARAASSAAFRRGRGARRAQRPQVRATLGVGGRQGRARVRPAGGRAVAGRRGGAARRFDGRLGAYYAAADIAFIGGSLLPLGGQNLIEACAVGVPVLIGKHVFNFTQATADAVAAGAALQVEDPLDLAHVLDALFADKARRIAMGAAGAAFASRHRGATARTVDVLAALLPPAERGGRALQDTQDPSDD